MWKSWLRYLRMLPLGLILVAMAAPASAATASELLSAAFSGDTSDYVEMTDEEMSEERGGLRSFSFGLYLTADVSSLGTEVPQGVDIVSQSPDLVSLSVGLAGLADTGGLIQFASVAGNNNIVNNNLTLNIYIIEDGVADTSNLFSTALGG